MERDQWAKEYKRLLVSFSKGSSSEQAALYFDALHTFPASVVVAAVSGAIREAKYWPTPADLVERARLERVRMPISATVCDVCQGSTWVAIQCDGVQQGEAGTKPYPVHRGRVCLTDDVVHEVHPMMTRCGQCSLDLIPKRESAA